MSLSPAGRRVPGPLADAHRGLRSTPSGRPAATAPRAPPRAAAGTRGSPRPRGPPRRCTPAARRAAGPRSPPPGPQGPRAPATACVEIKFYGAFVMNHRVVLHAIDATPARWRGDAGSSPLDRAMTAASLPRNDLVKNCRVHPSHLVDFHTGDGGHLAPTFASVFRSVM